MGAVIRRTGPDGPTLLLALAAGFLVAGLVGAPGRAEAQPRGAEAPTAVRVFTFKHRPVEEAAVLIRPVLTDGGSLVLQPKQGTMTVRDTPGAIDRVAQALQGFDVPPRPVVVTVRLLRATRQPAKKAGETGDKPELKSDLKGVGAQLSEIFSFTDYSVVDDVTVQTKEGESVSYAVGTDYHLSFRVESAGETVVRLKEFTLDRVRRGPDGREELARVLKSAMNLPVGQRNVVGIGKDEQAKSALFLVLVARTPGPGIAQEAD